MLNFSSLLVFSENPGRLADFYKQVFQKEPDWEGGDFFGFQVGDGMITIGFHDKVTGDNPNPERIMFNLETDEIEEEFARIKDLGATVVAEPYEVGDDMQICTLADPEGNYFQLMASGKLTN